MVFLAHVGIPTGIAWLAQSLNPSNSNSYTYGRTAVRPTIKQFAAFLDNLDYRLLMIGTMLPDIIDKPLGTWLLRDTVSNGRIFAHTILFALILLIAGVYLFLVHNKAGILWLAFGSVAHVCLDQMWLDPQTFYWPLYGWNFAHDDLTGWLDRIGTLLHTDPGVFVPEIIGAVILLAFAVKLLREGNLRAFLQTGRIKAGAVA